MNLPRLWRTVRWLRREQLLGRVRFRLARPAPDLRPAPAWRARGEGWVRPARRQASLLGPTRLRLLNETHDIDATGWDDAALPLLWRYNLHYFDDLNAADAGARQHWQVALVERWIRDNPPAAGTGWSPYPTSLRIVNWAKWFLGGQAPRAHWTQSLAVQARWLTRRIEWHLLGNHLFANAKALVFAGLCFDGAEAQSWLVQGLAILERELPEQVLADGGQFERSPMYHALALEDVLDLVNALACLAPPGAPAHRLELRLRQLAAPMLHWLRCMVHPDGSLARFNDCADGIAPPLSELERYADALGIVAAAAPTQGITRLQPSGYVRVAAGAVLALLDTAPVGPDYLPGHAHADTLSFELSLHGRELIVNRGTSVYGTGARRQLERGTAAHSTVQIGAHDSSEVWAGFRVGRRAQPGPVDIDGHSVAGSHDGYGHLPGRPRLARHWHFDTGSLTIEDRITPSPRGQAVARYHLAPGLRCVPADAGSWHILGPDGSAMASLAVVAGSAATVEAWQHAQSFGLLVPAQTLAVPLLDGRATVRLSWAT